VATNGLASSRMLRYGIGWIGWGERNPVRDSTSMILFGVMAHGRHRIHESLNMGWRRILVDEMLLVIGRRLCLMSWQRIGNVPHV
jgi:hypothetical protein